MDTLLLIVTVLSLLMATALAVIVVKMLGDERRRSDARVALLAELAAAEPEPQPVMAPPRKVVQPAPRIAAPPRVARAERAEIEVDLDLRSADAPVTAVGDLFVEPERTSPWGKRVAVAATIAAVLLSAVYLLSRPTGASTTVAPVQASEEQLSAPRPIELLALSQEQEPGRLTVRGVIANPRGAAARTRVVATAFAFGANGAFLASGRAPIDFTRLAPGDESPFVVTVPITGEVTRYRVGFRSEDGEVIAHVDRRTDTLAQK